MVRTADEGIPSSRTRRQRGQEYGRVVPVSHCVPFLRELADLGVPSTRALLLLGIGGGDESPLPEFISESMFRAFLRLAQELTGDSCLGLHAGARIENEQMASFDLVIRSQVYGDIFPHRRTHLDARIQNALTVEVSTADRAIVCSSARPFLPYARLVSEYLLAAVITCANQVFGPVDPIAVHLAHGEPSDTREHRRILGTRVCFGQPRNAVLLPLDLLSRRSRYEGATSVELILALAQATLDAGDAAPKSVHASSICRYMNATLHL